MSLRTKSLNWFLQKPAEKLVAAKEDTPNNFILQKPAKKLVGAKEDTPNNFTVGTVIAYPRKGQLVGCKHLLKLLQTAVVHKQEAKNHIEVRFVGSWEIETL